MYFGNTHINNITFGNTKVKGVYFGTIKVWPPAVYTYALANLSLSFSSGSQLYVDASNYCQIYADYITYKDGVEESRSRVLCSPNSSNNILLIDGNTIKWNKSVYGTTNTSSITSANVYATYAGINSTETIDVALQTNYEYISNSVVNSFTLNGSSNPYISVTGGSYALNGSVTRTYVWLSGASTRSETITDLSQMRITSDYWVDIINNNSTAVFTTNSSTSTRTATLILVDPLYTSASKSLTVTQEAGGFVFTAISPTSISVGSGETTFVITIKSMKDGVLYPSNGVYTEDWIVISNAFVQYDSCGYNSYTGEYFLTFRCLENSLLVERSATIVIHQRTPDTIPNYNDSDKDPITFTVTQEAGSSGPIGPILPDTGATLIVEGNYGVNAYILTKSGESNSGIFIGMEGPFSGGPYTIQYTINYATDSGNNRASGTVTINSSNYQTIFVGRTAYSGQYVVQPNQVITSATSSRFNVSSLTIG